MQAIGGAALLQKGSMAELSHSVFHTNFASNSSDDVGIANHGGELRCTYEGGCLPACTACLSPPTAHPTEDLSLRGTQRPTVASLIVVLFDDVFAVVTTPAPTPTPTVSKSSQRPASGRTRLMVGILVGCLALMMIGVVLWRFTRRYRGFGFDSGGGRGFELQQAGDDLMPSNQQRLLRLDDASNIASVMKSYEHSPAPVMVVCCNIMRITLWSPGMKIAAPMVVDPVGCLLSDLPFVNESDGYRLHRLLGRIAEAPAEHDHTRTFMLHLVTRHSHVLLEMVATHFFVTESEPIIVMTGRPVDSDLAGLMACNSEQQSVSQSGSTKDNDDDHGSLLINHSAVGDRLSSKKGFRDRLSSKKSLLTVTVDSPSEEAREAAEERRETDEVTSK